MFTFGMVVILTAVMISVSLSGLTEQKNEHSNKQKSIFQRDTASNRVLINLKQVGSKFNRLILRQDQQVVFNDDLTSISRDAVYRIDLSKLTKGRYIIELVTAQKENIQEEITID